MTSSLTRLRAGASVSLTETVGSNGPALRDDVAKATTAFAARSCAQMPDDTKVTEACMIANCLPPEFVDDEHEFYSRGSWQFGGY